MDWGIKRRLGGNIIEGSRPFSSFAGLVCLGLVVLPGAANGQGLPLSSRTKINGVVIPIFLEDNRPAAAVLKVDKIHTEYQRRGFFRIGLLPLVVMEGVKIDFRQANAASSALARLPKEMKPWAGSRMLELRDVKFAFRAEPKERLRAGKMRWLENGQWQLSNGVTIQMTPNEVQVQQALLQIAGPSAGTVAWGPPNASSSFNLFAFNLKTPATNLAGNNPEAK